MAAFNELKIPTEPRTQETDYRNHLSFSTAWSSFRLFPWLYESRKRTLIKVGII